MRTPRPILERRQFVRIVEHLPFKIGDQRYELTTSTLNISARGVMCRVDRDIPMMTKLEVGLSIPSHEKTNSKPKIVRTTGVVVRKEKDPDSQDYFIAIYFSGIKPKDQRLIEAYIEHRLKR